MIRIFGSLHIDPDEASELKGMLSEIGRRGIVAIELESNRETADALGRFRTLTDREINKVLEYQFGKRRIIATFNFIRLVSRYRKISRLVSIEPKAGKRISSLTKDVMGAYRTLDAYIRSAKSRAHEGGLPDRILRQYFLCALSQARQCAFRERSMARTVIGLARDNPDCDILLYCSESHSAYIKEYLKKERIRFSARRNRYTNLLERRWIRITSMVLATSYDRLGKRQLLELCREALLERAIWSEPARDISVRDYYRFGKVVDRRIGSLDDYRREMMRLDRFKASVRRELA